LYNYDFYFLCTHNGVLMVFYVLNGFNFLLTELFCANPQLKSSEMYTNTFAALQDLNSMAQKNVKEFYVHVTVHRNRFF
jgi:hypothetical protein